MDINSETKRIREAYNNYPGNPDPMNYKPQFTFTLLAILPYLLTFGIYNARMIGRVVVFIPILGILLFLVTLVNRGEEISNQDKIRQMYLYFVLLNVIMIGSYSIYLLSTSVTGLLQADFVIIIVDSLAGAPVTATAYYNIYLLYDISIEILNKESNDNSDKNQGQEET